MSGVLVVIEDRSGKISRISWEALAAGQKLAASLGLPLSAALIGLQTESLATETSTRFSGKVIRVEHPLLAHYTADGFTAASGLGCRSAMAFLGLGSATTIPQSASSVPLASFRATIEML